ncbi:MAG: acyl-CoA synthetase [Solirubrobacteraceae bacterium]|nr:acyl-CoA synthetase [Solirubrobacteraceae bacterium]
MLGTVSNKFHVARIMTRAGVVGSTVGRPDRGVRAIRALGDWGTSPAGAFTAAAIRSPNSIAVIDERGQLTYRDIHQRTNALAHHWASQGIGVDDIVALMARNHRGFVDATVALAKLGAHVLLLNTMFAGPQIDAVCARENVKLIVHDEEFSDLFDDIAYEAPRELSWVDDESAPHDFPTLGGIIVGANEDDHTAPAKSGRQIILTSGTTGMPKGAQRPSPKSIEPIAAFLERIPYRSGDSWMIAAPIFHAWGFLNWVLTTALSGSTVVRRRFDPEGTLDWIARYRCENLVVVPVMLQRIVELGPEVINRYDLSSLKVIAVSGSALPGDLAGRAMDLFGDVVYNLYGSTEVAIATIATPQDLREAPGTAGKPTRWTDLKILDDHGREVPQGEVGRIFIRSGLSFEGYTGGADKERINGLLSSGDVGHLDEAGRLFIDGRDDDMIITGGENVFPREIEDLLADHSSIEEASVIGVDDERWGQKLKAFVVLRTGETIDAQGVKDHVKAHLAGYKVPREVVFLEALPRNATGKVLKRELGTE